MVLVEAHKAGCAEVAVLGMSGSERQRGGGSLNNIGDFFERLKYLGFGDLPVLKPIGKYDVTYFDWCIYASPEHIAMEDRIHAELFPNISPNLQTYYASLGLDENTATAGDRGKWLNALCDVQALWAHINDKRDIFVTNDGNFLRKSAALVALGAGAIMTPEDAVKLI